jgi:hypothetical protein
VIERHDVENCTVDNCFKCKCATFQVSAKATPTRSADAIARMEFERTQEKDIPAYKRLRAAGLQPKSTRGAAELESRAESRWEVETGQRLEGNERFAGNAAKIGKKLDEVQAAVARGEMVTA